MPDHTPLYIRRQVLARDGPVCHYCGISLRQHEVTIDHIVPRSRSGRAGNHPDNLVVACGLCNQMLERLHVRFWDLFHRGRDGQSVAIQAARGLARRKREIEQLNKHYAGLFHRLRDAE